LDAAGTDLISRMLQCDPATRITAVQAMEHPFFSDLDPTFRASYPLLSRDQ